MYECEEHKTSTKEARLKCISENLNLRGVILMLVYPFYHI